MSAVPRSSEKGMPRPETFTSAIYLLNGEFVGKGDWHLANMSERWLKVCGDLLGSYGPVFTHNMGSTLSRFDIQLTAGVAHFRCGGELVLSAVYLPGVRPTADAGALSVFAKQILNSPAFAAACSDPSAFSSHLSTHVERPLAINFLWATPGVDEDDQGALVELAHHLAAEYLCRYMAADVT
jgi:hypothetical protein